MKLQREKVIELMKAYCGGNYNRFAREIGVDSAHLHRYLNTNVGGGKKIVFGVMQFCKDKNLDISDYIY